MRQWKPPFDKSSLVLESRRTPYQGFFRLEEVTFRHPLFAGGDSGPVTREVFERGDAVVVLAYDPQRDAVVLLEQLRYPAARTSDNPWLLELVAGIIEPGESNEQVARRELMEEAGLEAHSLEPICSFLSSPGACTERLYLYLAEVSVEAESGLFGLASEQEDIRRHVVPRTEALALMAEGRLDNASTLIGLQWLALNHHRRWGAR
ncbi:NUDIX domain-containing protein [Ferrimonas marina]|uniref:ADP-ribose pyrophosphatase n=1 Tax=Ferrimonas marina TaxID=299255 RepID=A0A1M5X5S0_9GAMM|nr:NUDIX domain-containing protein [Ferrimonas marina]SHH95136.1 ADP-ribose pyrophosphatase [Ferrimonas marina]